MNERLIDDILKHLDKETEMGVVRMSVEMDEKSDKGWKSPINAAICTEGRQMKRWAFWTAIRI